MARWFLRLALVLISIVGAGGRLGGCGPQRDAARELLVTCLTCGEQWMFAPSATLAAGFLSLIRRQRPPADKCPKCGSRAAIFGHPHHEEAANQRRTS